MYYKPEYVDEEWLANYKKSYTITLIKRGYPQNIIDAKIQMVDDHARGNEPDWAVYHLANSMDEDAGEWDVGEPVGHEIVKGESK